MPRMVSTQQANRRHEDKLRQLEDQLSAERVRVHNKLWEDTQRLQKDLIQLRIRTPNTTHAGKPVFCAPGRASRPKLASRAVVVRRDNADDAGKLVSGSGRAPRVGREVPDSSDEKSGKQIQRLCADGTDGTQRMVTVREEKHSGCAGNVLVYVSDQHEEKNAYDQKPEGSDVGSESKNEGSQTIPGSGRGRRVKESPGIGSDRKQTWPLISHTHQTLTQTSMTENKNASIQEENHKKKGKDTTVSDEGLHSDQRKKNDPPDELQVEVTETSGKRSILSQMSTLYHIGSVSNCRLPNFSDSNVNPQNSVDGKEETCLKISDLLAPVNRRISYLTEGEQSCQQTQARTSHSSDSKQTALQIRRETVRKHQQSVLPTVQVQGDNVRYFYQGLPGQVKTFTPDSRTQTLLRRNSQIGSNLQHLYQKKSSYRSQALPKEHPSHISDDDPTHEGEDELKNQIETFLHGWSQAAAQRRKLLLHKQRKAKMKSLLTMKSTLNSRSSTDLEDESLSGWRLLKLFRLWSSSGSRDRPVWATSSYLRRKHQENEQHQHRQQRHAAADVQTRVLEAMSAGVGRKSHPDTGIRTKSTAKPWLRKAKHAKSQPSGLFSPHASNKTRCLMDHVDPAAENQTLPECHPEQGSVRGTKGNGLRGFKRVPGAGKRPGVRDCEYRGRRVVLGMEHRMWVGNLSLSTGLTGTVASSRRHPDVLVRKEH